VIDSRCVITILPESTVMLLSVVKFLSGPASDQLKALRYSIEVIINDQKMNMTGCTV
jgi:hypothetical protein